VRRPRLSRPVPPEGLISWLSARPRPDSYDRVAELAEVGARGIVVDQQQTPKVSYVERILDNFAAHPDREAVVDEARRVTYAQARSWVLRMAQSLRRRGVSAGDTVAIFTANRAEGVLLPLAVHLVGARLATIPLVPSPSEQIGFLARAEADAFVIGPAIGRAAEFASQADVPVTLVLGEDLFAPIAGDELVTTDWARPDDIATLFYTGGTTGRPKLVLHGHGYYAALVQASARREAESPAPHRFLICTMLDHTSGHISAVIALLAGGTVVLRDRFDPGTVFSAMLVEKISSLVLVPPMLIELLDHPALPTEGFPDLVRLHYGGGPTPSARIRQAIERFGPVLRQTYGLTEMPVVTVLEPADHDTSVPGRLTAVGRPLPGLRERGGISLRDEHGEVPPGAVGEVCVRGPLVMREYWKDPEKTAEVIRDGWFRTGDLGRWDEDGYLHLVDRIRDMIITGQSADNVYCGLLEEVLASHQGVRLAAAVGMPDDAFGEAVHVVCVTTDPLTSVDPDDLRRLVTATLGSLYEPRTVTFTDSLPLTRLGKIDKKALRELLRTKVGA
jgi:fatty-acyl-CoA synthase